LDSGSRNFSNRGEIYSFDAQRWLNNHRQQIWKSRVDINGTVDIFNNPLSNSDQLTIFEPEQVRNLFFTPHGITYEFQFYVNNLRWDSKNFHQDLSEYDCLVGGFNNLSKIRDFQWFASLPYFNNSKHW
jgi:hypothetical protein